MVVEQVDLVDVEHAAVRAGQQPGSKVDLPAPQSRCRSSEPITRSSVAPTGSSTSRAGRVGDAVWTGMRPIRAPGSGSSGSQLNRQPSTTWIGGSTCASARTMVVLAVPFSPRTKTPPTSGETAVRTSASAMSSEPTMAENGYLLESVPVTPDPSRGCPRPLCREVAIHALVGRRPDAADVLTSSIEVTVAGPLRTRTGFLRRTASMMS